MLIKVVFVLTSAQKHINVQPRATVRCWIGHWSSVKIFLDLTGSGFCHRIIASAPGHVETAWWSIVVLLIHNQRNKDHCNCVRYKCVEKQHSVTLCCEFGILFSSLDPFSISQCYFYPHFYLDSHYMVFQDFIQGVSYLWYKDLQGVKLIACSVESLG